VYTRAAVVEQKQWCWSKD